MRRSRKKREGEDLAEEVKQERETGDEVIREERDKGGKRGAGDEKPEREKKKERQEVR